MTSKSTTSWLIPSLAYVLLVGVLGTTTKLAFEDVAWQQLVLWTGVAYAVLAAGLVIFSGTRLRLVQGTGYGAISGVLAATGLIMFFLALNAGEVSRVIPITSAYPVFTLLLASVILSERVTPRRIVATLLVIGGVILLSID